MQQLESVELEFFYSSVYGRDRKPIPAADFVAAFKSLRCMHSLTLVQWNDVDDLLPHLIHAPALRSLTLRPDVRVPNSFADSKTSVPSVSVLRQLLAATAQSQLVCTLVLWPRSSEVQAAQVLTSMFSALGDDIPDAEAARFHIVSEFGRV
jgi:hypothetical protein